jgi:hypothetical protein
MKRSARSGTKANGPSLPKTCPTHYVRLQVPADQPPRTGAHTLLVLRFWRRSTALINSIVSFRVSHRSWKIVGVGKDRLASRGSSWLTPSLVHELASAWKWVFSYFKREAETVRNMPCHSWLFFVLIGTVPRSSGSSFRILNTWLSCFGHDVTLLNVDVLTWRL